MVHPSSHHRPHLCHIMHAWLTRVLHHMHVSLVLCGAMLGYVASTYVAMLHVALNLRCSDNPAVD
jgi:hypothetical protein